MAPTQKTVPTLSLREVQLRSLGWPVRSGNDTEEVRAL